MNEATIAKKQEEVLAVVNKINGASSTLFVDYLGLTVAEITQLRVKLHAENCEMKVIKNNILRRAAEKAGYEDLNKHGFDQVPTGSNWGAKDNFVKLTKYCAEKLNRRGR